MNGAARVNNLSILKDHAWLKAVYGDTSLSQLTFTCSKLPIETLEKSVKYVQS